MNAACAAEGSAAGGRSPAAAAATSSLLSAANAAAAVATCARTRAARAGVAAAAASPRLLAATSPPITAAEARAARWSATAPAAAAEAAVRGQCCRKSCGQRLRERVAPAAIATPATAAVAAAAHRGVGALGRMVSGEAVAGGDEPQQGTGLAPSSPLPPMPSGLTDPLPARRGDSGERGARGEARRAKAAAGSAAEVAAARGGGDGVAGTRCHALVGRPQGRVPQAVVEATNGGEREPQAPAPKHPLRPLAERESGNSKRKENRHPQGARP